MQTRLVTLLNVCLEAAGHMGQTQPSAHNQELQTYKHLKWNKGLEHNIIFICPTFLSPFPQNQQLLPPKLQFHTKPVSEPFKQTGSLCFNWFLSGTILQRQEL